MKKLLILLSPLATSLLLGATVDVTPTSSSRATVPNPGSNADQLVLHSDSFSSYAVGAGLTATYQSMNVVKGSGETQTLGNANFALGTLVIDANTASGDFEAINIGTLDMNYFDFKVTNTAAENTANVVLNFTNLNIRSYSSPAQQKQNFSFDNVRATVNAGQTNLSNGYLGADKPNTSTISVNSTANVTWKGTFNAEKYAQLNINGTFIANSGSHTFKDGSVVTVGSTGTYWLNATTSALTIQSGATFDFSSGGTFTQDPGSTFNMNGTMTYAKAVTFLKMTTAGTFTQSANNTSYGVTLTRPTDFNSGANWTAHYRFTLYGGGSSDALLANVNINDGASITITKMASQPTAPSALIMRGNASLTVNAENAFNDGEGGNVALVTYNGTSNNKVTLNASQKFHWIFANSSDLDIIMADGVTLQLTSGAHAIQIGGNAMIKIYNFAEDSIYVGTDSGVANLVTSNVKLFDASSIELGTAYVNGSGFITLIPVPEPAEWAAIFGAIALGFALYRRRK